MAARARAWLRRTALALAALALALGLGVVAVGLVARLRMPEGFHEIAEPEGRVLGAWHVHTARSDGRGSEDDVALAAREANLQFVVLAEHNKDPLPPRWRRGVLLVDAVEISASAGHVVALGVTRAPQPAERANVFLWVHRNGGEAYVAHPTHERRGWRDEASLLSADGLEVVSMDSGLHALRRVDRLVPSLLAWPLAPEAVLRTAAAFDAPALALARRLRDMGSAGIRLCAADAHGWPPYELMFRTVRLALDVTLPPDPVEAARVLRMAIAFGRGECQVAGAPSEAAADADGVTAWSAPSLLVGSRTAIVSFPLKPPGGG